MADPVYVSVRLPLKIGPIERDEFWEDPLSDKLQDGTIGEVTGGGTMMAADGGIDYCDLEIEMADLSDDRLDKLQSLISELGAPKGTAFVDDDGETLRTFGDISVVGIGLDGSGLPDSAYEGFDPDEFNDTIVAALGDGHSYGGSYAGARYTYFYYHGRDAKFIEDTLRKVAQTVPIGQGAQFQHIA